MQQILVYGDSLTWGIVPGTRQRLPFAARWPIVLEAACTAAGRPVRVIEDCLNGRRTVWDDPFKPGRNGLVGLAQRMEVHAPLALVILMLGTNDFQSVHDHNAWHSAQGLASLIAAIRAAPIEPGMPVPPILVIAPPAIGTPCGTATEKFAGGDTACRGLATALAALCAETGCHFLDAGTRVSASAVDGVHLDAAAHRALGAAVAEVVRTLPIWG